MFCFTCSLGNSECYDVICMRGSAASPVNDIGQRLRTLPFDEEKTWEKW